MAKPNTISTIEAFERECHIRFENIDKRFDSGTKRFDKLDIRSIWFDCNCNDRFIY
jgi:hypothetical protein